MRNKILTACIIGVLLVTIAVVYNYRYLIRNNLMHLFRERALTQDCPGCSYYFPDVVSVQEQAYYKERMIPKQTLKDLDKEYERGYLVSLNKSDKYEIENMNFARPYVLPVVIDFLKDLSIEYEKNLREAGLSYYPFVITNATRSIESAAELTEVINIARKKSHHLYGKTIDISYKQFGGHEKEQSCFIKALRDLRKGKRCFVKFEKTGALHLTVR